VPDRCHGPPRTRYAPAVIGQHPANACQSDVAVEQAARRKRARALLCAALAAFGGACALCGEPPPIRQVLKPRFHWGRTWGVGTYCYYVLSTINQSSWGGGFFSLLALSRQLTTMYRTRQACMRGIQSGRDGRQWEIPCRVFRSCVLLLRILLSKDTTICRLTR
jgi:hypothetical protein